MPLRVAAASPARRPAALRRNQPGARTDTVTNRVTLAQLANLPTLEVQALPLPQIAMLLEDVAAMMREAKAHSDRLQAALHACFGAEAAFARRAEDKLTGTITLAVEGSKVRCDLPKKVEWDQRRLAEAVEMVRSWGEPVGDYVTIEYKVSETAYAAWPSSIRAVFEPARTVSAGKPTYKIDLTEAA